jgi:ABC-type polysaccharide/polyol phosphate transport system ATPase subunit
MTIILNQVSLSYSIPTESRNSLKDTLIAVTQRKKLYEKRLALNNISMILPPGETVGIIGRNGSGKSSLLKLIAGILPPSLGEVQTKGKLAAMVELGAGFHPELTAYENILVYGRLLGTEIEVMRDNADEILKWANLEEQKNTPVRTFSSGMLARLGFAIATNQNPDILLIDEVLSVGDQEFAEKSRRRMDEMMSTGRTILLASHDLATIREVCKKTIFLEKGNLRAFGNTRDVTTEYEISFT